MRFCSPCQCWELCHRSRRAPSRLPPAQDATRSGNDCLTQDATPFGSGGIALRHARLEAEIAASLQVNAVLCRQLLETRLDRERWRRQAQQLVATLPARVESHPQRLRLTAQMMGLV